MKVLRILVLLAVIALIGACLQEKNEGALGNTYSTLYAFFETASASQAGCYPDTNNNNTVSVSTVRAVYSFQIERPMTLVVCVKNTTDTTGITGQALYDLEHALDGHTISFFVSNTKINPGDLDIIDNIRIPNLGALTSNSVMGSSLVCPFNPTDSTVSLVGRYDMDSLTDYQYIIAADDACGMCVGTGQSPFWLAKQYGVTY
jgi:hypothetical protein